MTNITRSALLPYSAQAVFDLINDVEAYPQYMEGCVGAEVFSRDEDTVVARLDLARGGIQQSFTTRNRLERPNRVALELMEGPFERFEGEWSLLALGEAACKVSLHLKFTLSNRVLNLAARQIFNSAANNLVDAVVKRANELYGK